MFGRGVPDCAEAELSAWYGTSREKYVSKVNAEEMASKLKARVEADFHKWVRVVKRNIQ